MTSWAQERRLELVFDKTQARQVTADLLRAGGDAIAPADDSKTLRERFTDLIGGN